MVGYLAIAVVLFTWRASGHVSATLAWIAEGREPDPGEHRRTLLIAVTIVKLTAVAWVVAAVLFAAVNALAHSWGFAAVTAATVALGGETTCAFLYATPTAMAHPRG